MTQLAIKGHPTRGKEVIQLLEMLGGVNCYNLYGNTNFSYYTIENNEIKGGIYIFSDEPYKFFTLEEFEKLYPYKVGDRVRVAEYESKVCISNMYWDGWEVQYEVVTDEVEWYSTKELNEFNETNKEDMENKGNISYGYHTSNKEETIEGVYTYNEINCYHQDFGDKVRIRLGNDFEIKVEDKITYIVKKKPTYPKTYVECCEVLDIQSDWHLTFELNNSASCDLCVNKEFEYVLKLEAFRKLYICRNAYWKIAGEQMGLGKPWEPDWNDVCDKYTIYTVYGNEIWRDKGQTINTLLAFTTAEMRDAFYENFKDLIEECKELL